MRPKYILVCCWLMATAGPAMLVRIPSLNAEEFRAARRGQGLVEVATAGGQARSNPENVEQRPPLTPAKDSDVTHSSPAREAFHAPLSPDHSGAPAPSKAPLGSLEYRRVLIPADEIPNQTRGYLPVKQEVFEGQVDRMGQRGGPRGELLATAREANYSARLEGDQLVGGQARLEIVHQGRGAATAPLRGTSLALGNPRWTNNPERSDTIGLSPSGELVALVTESDTLQFDWTHAGHRLPDGTLRFEIQFPHCLVSRLWLDVPDGLALRADGGLVLQVDDSDALASRTERRIAPEGMAAFPSPWNSTPAKGKRWRIDVGAPCRVTLEVAADSAAEDQRRIVLYRQSSTYDLSERGLELSTELRLQTHHQALDQVPVELGPDLELTAARLGDRHIPWTLVSIRGNEATRVVLDLPSAVQGGDQRIRLSAIAPLVRERPWKLPDIRPLDMFWQEGTATLLVRQPLELEQLVVHDGRPSRLEPLPAPQSGESIELQYFDANASCEVQVATVSTRVNVESHTAVTIGGSAAIARIVYNFTATKGDRFQLDADIADPWILESVQSDPASALDDWSVESSVPAKQRLMVQLREALRPGHDLRLVVQARHPLPPEGVRFGLDHLEPVRFQDVTSTPGVMGIRADAPYQLTISDDSELTRLESVRLAVPDESTSERAHWDCVFLTDRGAQKVGFSLGRSDPRYTADISVDATVDGDWLLESYLIRCQPESSRVDRLLVQFTPSRSELISWTLEGQMLQAQPQERDLTDQRGVAQGGREGETWDVRLPRPLSEPFTIQARRRIARTDRQPVALATVPEATSQRGQITVRCHRGASLAIEPGRRLRAVPAMISPGTQIETVRAVYRYEPDEMVDGGESLLLRRVDGPERQPAAWVWLSECVSSYIVSGAAIHTVTFRLENTGLEQLAMEMPPGSRLDQLSVDGVVIPVRNTTELDAPCVVPLPAAVRYPTVTVQFATYEHRLGAVDRLDIELPDLGLAVFDRRWVVHLPPSYEVWRSDPWILDQRDWHPSWSRRLFGPLGDRAGPPFDLFNANHWTGLVSGSRLDDRARPASRRWAGAPWHSSSQPTAAENPLPFGPGLDVPLADSGPARLHIYHAETMRFYGWVAFFTTFGLVWFAFWRGWRPLRTLVLMAGLSGALTQGLPAPFFPLAAGIFWALVASGTSCVCGLLAGRWTDTRARRPAAATTAGARSTVRLLGVLVLWIGSRQIAAGQPHEPVPQDAKVPAVHNVLVPIDQQGRQAVDYVYVPRDMYDLLHRIEQQQTDADVDWLILSAEYRGALMGDQALSNLAIPQLSATYGVLVKRAPARIGLALRQSDFHVLADGIRLDGRNAAASWSDDGNLLIVDVDQSGFHHIQLSLRPIPEVLGDASGFQATVPAVADSRLTLALPTPIPDVRVHGAHGATSVDRAGQMLRSELGPSGALGVSWRGTGAQDDRNRQFDVEQLMWMEIRPGAVVIDAQWRIRVRNGTLRTLVLSTDPRLRWLPLEDETSISQIRTYRAELQTLHLDFAAPVDGQTSLRTRFLLTDTSGIGHLQFPLLEVEGAQEVSKWLAISTDPSLEFEVGPTDVTPLDPAAFLDEWPARRMDPDLVYRLPQGRFSWSLATHLRAPKTTAFQSLSLFFDADVTEIHFIADLSTIDGFLFQHRVGVPPEMEVQSIALVDPATDQAADLLTRWSRDANGQIHIFCTRPISGSHRLVLHGRVPTNLSSEVPVPWVQVDQAQILSSHLRMSRSSDVLVDVTSSEGLAAIDTDANGQTVPRAQNGLARLISTFACLDTPNRTATIRVRKNEPRVEASTLSRLYRRGDQWWTDVDISLEVEQGQLDVIRLDAPSAWGERVSFDSTVGYRWTQTEGSDRRRLLLWPQRPVDGPLRLRVSGSLSMTAGQGIGVPEILLRDVDTSERLVVVPTHIDEQPLSWQTTQLRPCPLPDDLATELGGGLAAFVAGGNFRALGRPQKVGLPPATIPLADLRLALRQRGPCYGVAAFHLEPAGGDQFAFRLPETCRLIQLRVAGLPATPTNETGHTWRFALPSASLPQRIEVIYSASLPWGVSGGGVTLPAPEIEGVRVTESVWTVRCEGPRPWKLEGGAPLSSYQCASRLYRSSALCVLGAWTQTGQDLPEDLAPWYAPWAGTLAAYRRQLDRFLPELPRATAWQRSQREQWDQIDQQLITLESQLDGTGIQREPLRGRVLASDPLSVWDSVSAPSARTSYRLAGPPGHFQSVRVVITKSPGGLYRLAAGISMLVLALLVGLAPRQTAWSAPVLRGWPIIGIAFGLFWWLCLAPSLAGWLIVALSLYAAVRPHPNTVRLA